MTTRLAEWLDTMRSAAPAAHDGSAVTASIISGHTSTNIAVGTYVGGVTIVHAKGGWRAVDAREVRKIRSRYYVPAEQAREQFTKAQSSLDWFGVAVLEGEHGTGKRSDAIRLLAATTPDSTPIFELSPDWEGDRPDTSLLPREGGYRFLLDLTSEGSELTEEFAHDLLGYGRALKRVDSQIVVLVAPSIWAPCRPIMRDQTVNLPPRDPELVIKAHITYRDVSLGALPLLRDEPLHGLISELRERRASPAEAVRLAESLVGATAKNVSLIVEAHRRWKSYIGEQLDSRREGWADRRILLIAIAVLNHAPSTAVVEASQKLAIRLGQHRVPLYRALESEGWATRLKEIEASVTDDRTHLNPNKRGLDLAIVEWLWRERPELRRAFLDWIAELTSDPLTGKHSDRLVSVLVHLVRTFRSRDLFRQLYLWLKDGGKSRKLAEDTLAALLVDDTAAGVTQGRLWKWAYRGSPAVIASLALLCGGTFGQTYPQVALARLRHLAARADEPDAKHAVANAIRALAEHEGTRFLVLENVLEWSRDGSAGRAGPVALTALLDTRQRQSVAPQLIEHASADERMLQLLRHAWAALTEHSERAELAELTRQWSLLRDDGTLDAATVNRLWAPAMEQILMGQPKSAFLEAMTDRTRSEILLHTVSESTIKHNPCEAPALPLEFSAPVGHGEPPAE